jgi:hypothetical protein
VLQPEEKVTPLRDGHRDYKAMDLLFVGGCPVAEGRIRSGVCFPLLLLGQL